MIRRTTWIFLAILVVLVGVTWYLQRSPQKTTVETTPIPTAAKLFDFEENELAGVRFQDSLGRVVELSRVPGSPWVLVQPEGLPADEAKAEAAVSQVLSMNVVTSLDTPPGLGDMGLTQALYTLVLRLTGGRELQASIGNATPIGNGYYLKRGDGSVVVVSKFPVEALIKLLDNPPAVDTPTPEPEVQPTLDATQPVSTTVTTTPAVTATP